MSAGPFSNDMVWHVCADDLHFADLGDVETVFDKRSGDTHILNFLSKALLDCLARSPLTLRELEPRVLEEIEMTAEDCPFSLIKSTLLQLDELGLVLISGRPTNG